MNAEVRTAVTVWGALMLLLALTVGATFVPMGSLRTVANISIAFAKAGLVFAFYMHLREEGGLVRLAAVGAVIWLAILLCLMSSDYLTRG